MFGALAGGYACLSCGMRYCSKACLQHHTDTRFAAFLIKISSLRQLSLQLCEVDVIARAEDFDHWELKSVAAPVLIACIDELIITNRINRTEGSRTYHYDLLEDLRSCSCALTSIRVCCDSNDAACLNSCVMLTHSFRFSASWNMV